MSALLALVMTFHVAGACFELTDNIILSLDQEVYENTIGAN